MQPAPTVTVTFVKSPQNVKCPVLSNHLINPDSVHGFLRNSAILFSRAVKVLTF